MFSLARTTPVSRDCSAGYCVNLDKEYTFKEFIDAVLTNKNEWGLIEIAKRDCTRYSYPFFRYRYGEIQSEPNIPEAVYGYKVKSVKSCGGWKRMDYIVTLEKEVD